MNKERRKTLHYALGFMKQASDLLDSVRSDESYSFSNMPENLASSEQGEQMEEAIAQMDNAALYAICAMDAVKKAME